MVSYQIYRGERDYQNLPYRGHTIQYPYSQPHNLQLLLVFFETFHPLSWKFNQINFKPFVFFFFFFPISFALKIPWLPLPSLYEDLSLTFHFYLQLSFSVSLLLSNHHLPFLLLPISAFPFCHHPLQVRYYTPTTGAGTAKLSHSERTSDQTFSIISLALIARLSLLDRLHFCVGRPSCVAVIPDSPRRLPIPSVAIVTWPEPTTARLLISARLSAVSQESCWQLTYAPIRHCLAIRSDRDLASFLTSLTSISNWLASKFLLLSLWNTEKISRTGISSIEEG